MKLGDLLRERRETLNLSPQDTVKQVRGRLPQGATFSKWKLGTIERNGCRFIQRLEALLHVLGLKIVPIEEMYVGEELSREALSRIIELHENQSIKTEDTK